jgi:hypothetical protein
MFSSGPLETAMKAVLSQWAYSLPIVLVWMAGLLFALRCWRRNRRVSLLVAISCGLSLLVTLVMPIVSQFAFALFRPSYSSVPFLFLSMAVSVLWHCLAAISSGLLIYAAFVDRPQGR